MLSIERSAPCCLIRCGTGTAGKKRLQPQPNKGKPGEIQRGGAARRFHGSVPGTVETRSTPPCQRITTRPSLEGHRHGQTDGRGHGGPRPDRSDGRWVVQGAKTKGDFDKRRKFSALAGGLRLGPVTDGSIPRFLRGPWATYTSSTTHHCYLERRCSIISSSGGPSRRWSLSV